MPVFKRRQLPQIIQEIDRKGPAPVYLVFGERYLARSIANDLLAALLPDAKQRDRQLVRIDGDQEEPLATLNQLRTLTLFGGRKVFQVHDSRLLLSKKISSTLWDKAAKAYHADKQTLAARYIGQLLALLPDPTADPGSLMALSASSWKKTFGFAKPAALEWLAKLPSPPVSQQPRPHNDPAQAYCSALQAGLPADHILLLVTDTVDKRKKLYTCLKEVGVIIDASVETGISTAARKQQDSVLRDLIADTLRQFGKTMSPAVQNELLNRVGFHPVAVVMEVEKLALYTGDAPAISRRDLELLVGRTREEALFQLNDALSRRDLDRALLLTARLQADGMHPLAVIAGLRNHIRKLLRIRALQLLPDPPYTVGMQAQAFQHSYLPALKKGQDLTGLPGHPYALYKTFQQAGAFGLTELIAMLATLLKAEYRLKSTSLPADIVLDNLLLTLLHQRHAA